jgi:competence ComEA-like helix-hairpin-helix protein
LAPDWLSSFSTCSVCSFKRLIDVTFSGYIRGGRLSITIFPVERKPSGASDIHFNPNKEIFMENLRRGIFAMLLALPLLLQAGETVNINTADKDALMTLKGIGEKRADAIIAYREQYGPFKSVDQLAEIEGIGQSFIDSNRELLAVEDKQQ